MAEPHDNSITRDSIETRLYRLMRMQNNIDTNAVELSVSGALLSWAQGCYDRFSDANTASAVEDGESKDATIILHDLWANLLDFYQQTKDILDARLRMFKPDEHLRASYGIDVRTPDTYNALIQAVENLIAKHDELVLASDERVIAQGIIDQLTAHHDAFAAQLETAGIERRESDEAFNRQHAYFDEDTENLRYIFTIAKLIWGDDDPKLKDLGFVPSSEIWTPGQPEPPEPGGATYPDPVENLLAENITTPIIVNKVSWDVLAGAHSYSIKKAEVDLGQVAPPMPEEYYAQDYIDNTPVGDNDIVPGKTYYYWVCGVDETGVEGEWAICSCDYPV